MKDQFIKAIHNKQKVNLTFYTKDKVILTRICAPMDYGISDKYPDYLDRYYLWDYEGKHPLPLKEEQIVSIVFTSNLFDPYLFITWWPMTWIIKRNWGKFS